MRIDKFFDITVSHRFPNGDIVSLKFGTSKQIDNILDDADSAVIKKLERDLSKQVITSTYRDMQREVKDKRIVKEVMDSIPRAIKSQEAELTALKKMESLDDD